MTMAMCSVTGEVSSSALTGRARAAEDERGWCGVAVKRVAAEGERVVIGERAEA